MFWKRSRVFFKEKMYTRKHECADLRNDKKIKWKEESLEYVSFLYIATASYPSEVTTYETLELHFGRDENIFMCSMMMKRLKRKEKRRRWR